MDLRALIRYQNYLANRGGESSWHTGDAPVKVLNRGFAHIQQGCVGFDMSLKSLQEIQTQVQGEDVSNGREAFQLPQQHCWPGWGAVDFLHQWLEFRCLPRLSPEQPSPPAVGSDLQHTSGRVRVSLQAPWEAENKKGLKCTIPAKARWGGPVVINRVCEMRGCFPLCPSLLSNHGGEQWGCPSPGWYLTPGRIPSSAAATGTGHHWRSSRGNRSAQRPSGQEPSHPCCQLHRCKEET